MKAFKPIVAAGAAHPLEDELLMADYFRKTNHTSAWPSVSNYVLDGVDGLGGVHTSVSI